MKSAILLSIAFFYLLYTNNIFGSSDDSIKKINKNNELVRFSKFNINKISTYIYNNGNADIDPRGNSGLVFPTGSHKAVIYESGFVWGGKINGKVLVGGSTYSQGLLGGKILENGKAEDPNDESVRVYRVRPDYANRDYTNEIIDENKTVDEIFLKYEKDWNEWPAQFGAPFYDADNDGIYNPNIDIPGVAGSDQTLWFVANDLDSNQAKNLYGSPTMGVELQVTIWGYKNLKVLENTLFKKFVLINKSENSFEDTYVSVWSDPDVGDAGDDYVGCDTTLSLGFAYNGDSYDGVYEQNVPAVGFKFFQGPLVDGTIQDIGKFNGKFLIGKKNLPMTSFSYFIGSDPVYSDPNLGDYIRGTLQYYNLMKGRISATGGSFIDPKTGIPTVYTLSGDPTNGKGWVDGITHPPGDRRIVLNSGPFTMASGDTQEVIIAQIVAGGEPGIDRLQAVHLLKQYNGLAQQFYDFNFSSAGTANLKAPIINKIELDEEIILTWFDDENLAKIESNNNSFYSFQGYSVYQFPNDRFHKNEAKEILTIDIIDGITKIISSVENIEDNSSLYEVIKFGTDSGIRRHVSIKKDFIKSEAPLNNGSKYYFGISAYTTNNNLLIYPPILESNTNYITAVPQKPKPGNFYEGKYGEKLEVSSNSDNSLKINIQIVDPTKTISGIYKITFNGNSSEVTSWRNLSWDLSDKDDNLILENEKITLQDQLGLVKPIYFNGLEIDPFDFDTTVSNAIKIDDIFTFYSPGTIINDPELAIEEVGKINVFPNPYYCTQNNEIHQFDRFVTFSHLPQNAILRIYNLAGHLVRTLEKNDDSQFLKWNLTNESNFLIASGVYLAYIELPKLRKTKVLKLAIIMETVVPDFF